MITSTLLALGLGSSESAFSVNSKKNNNDPEGKTGATPLIREAMFYKKLSHDRVECEVCFRRCIIHEGERGECKNKQNSGGKLYNVVWSRPSSIAIDPIEKEPQLHMLPGTYILCFGTAGCNFRCRFCQNWQLSQQSIEAIGYFYPLGPTAAVSEAKKRLIPTLSFTYNEPTSFYEYVYDIAKIAKSQGLNILWHSNGAMNPTPLKELLKYTDAVTIDLKGFTEKFYKHYSQGELEAVLQTLKIVKNQGVWLEIVNLVIPTANDDPQDVLNMCEWIKDNLGDEVPLHFSRFFPAYRLTKLPPTPIETLERCYNIAKDKGLHFVTIGNVPGHIYNSTFCPECGKLIIKRMHFQVMENKIVDGHCSFCSHPIPGIWKT
ncbi:MAG: AmmeMemoRadiSam system radical SAM enzyme [Spirochaetota bacterium]|nr:MAG: AmmeMemoRadiSam system radical SAM enzyme [Spirochaetota bacterium]